MKWITRLYLKQSQLHFEIRVHLSEEKGYFLFKVLDLVSSTNWLNSASTPEARRETVAERSIELKILERPPPFSLLLLAITWTNSTVSNYWVAQWDRGAWSIKSLSNIGGGELRHEVTLGKTEKRPNSSLFPSIRRRPLAISRCVCLLAIRWRIGEKKPVPLIFPSPATLIPCQLEREDEREKSTGQRGERGTRLSAFSCFLVGSRWKLQMQLLLALGTDVTSTLSVCVYMCVCIKLPSVEFCVLARENILIGYDPFYSSNKNELRTVADFFGQILSNFYYE